MSFDKIFIKMFSIIKFPQLILVINIKFYTVNKLIFNVKNKEFLNYKFIVFF